MNKLKNFLIILLIINIFALIFLILKKPLKAYNLSEYWSYVATLNEIPVAVYKDENKVELYNMLDIIAKNYKGEIPINKTIEKLTYLIEGGFKELYNATYGMNTSSLANYLEQNKEDIAMKTGIIELNDFVSFLQKIQIYKNDVKFQSGEIIEDSYVNGGKYDNFKVKLLYENEQALIFDVYLSNRDFIDTPIIIIK